VIDYRLLRLACCDFFKSMKSNWNCSLAFSVDWHSVRGLLKICAVLFVPRTTELHGSKSTKSYFHIRDRVWKHYQRTLSNRKDFLQILIKNIFSIRSIEKHRKSNLPTENFCRNCLPPILGDYTRRAPVHPRHRSKIDWSTSQPLSKFTNNQSYRVVKMKVLAVLLVVVAIVAAEVYFKETFNDGIYFLQILLEIP
jgi:hypothetical protein